MTRNSYAFFIWAGAEERTGAAQAKAKADKTAASAGMSPGRMDKEKGCLMIPKPGLESPRQRVSKWRTRS